MISRASAHEIGHDFMDYMSKLQRGRPLMAWKGTKSGHETWMSYTFWMMAHFRDWALEQNIPREDWEIILNEVMMD